MPPRPRRLAPLLATSALAGAAFLGCAAPLAAAPTWTPVHTVSGSVAATGEPDAILFGGPRSPQGFTATSAWTAWESGGVIHTAERPAALGAWAPAVPISGGGGGASALAIAGASLLAASPGIAVWQRVVGGDTVIEAAMRTDGSWAPAERLSALDETATDPSVSDWADPVVAWLRAEDSGASVVEAAVRSRIGAGSWGEPTAISDPGAVASDVRVIPRGSGHLVVWRSAEGGESRIRAALHSRETGTWSTPLALSPAGEAASEPRVAIASDGTAVVVWMAGAGQAATIRATTLPAGSTEPTAPATISAPGASEPEIAMARGTVAVWRRIDGSDEMIEAAIRPDDSGAWSAPERLSPEGERADDPAVAAGAVFRRVEEGVAPFDTALQVVWASVGAGGTAVMAASRAQGGGPWDTPRQIAPPGAPVEGLRLVVGNGEALALWRRDGGPVEGAAYDTQGPLYADLSIEPTEPRVGQPVRFRITPIDTWSPVARTEWELGDGATAAGSDVQHAYGIVRRPFVAVRVLLADAVGNETSLAGYQIRPFEYEAPSFSFVTQVVCAQAPTPPKGKPPGRIRLSARQLLVSQRIAQAAVRRANAIGRWLDAGIETRDICGAAFGTAAFNGITDAVGGGGPIEKPRPNPRPLDEAPPAGPRTARVALTPGQLLVNQRIAQAALRRLEALEARLRSGLTGGDLRDGAITAGQLSPGLEIRGIRPPAAPTPPSVTPPPAPPKGGEPARVALTAAQLRINQRIAQAAVRRANALRDVLTSGLAAGHFRPGTIDASKLDPSLRRG